MSKPLRAQPCGCIVATQNNRFDEKPKNLLYGKETIERFNNCRLNNPNHIKVHHSLEITTKFGEVVGSLNWNEGCFSKSISVPNIDCVKYFDDKDVYVVSSGWDFAKFRKPIRRSILERFCNMMENL